MKLIFQSVAILMIFSFFTHNANAQWYSYDKAEKKEKDPQTIINLINKFQPAIAAVKITVKATDKEKKKELQTFLNNNRSSLITLNKNLRTQSGILTDDERAVLYFLRRKNLPFNPFFPVRTVAQAQTFYENSDSLIIASDDGIFNLEHAYLNYLSKSKKLAAYSEVAHDYIGPVRLSLGLLGLVPSSKDSAVTTKKSDSIYNMQLFQDRFKSAGGMAQLSASFALMHLHDERYFDFKLYASPRFCIDVPKEDTSVQRFAHHTQLGAEAQLKIVTFEKVFSFLLCWRGFQAWGNSTFYDNMGFTGTDQRKSFNFNTWTVGVIVKDKLQFYYTWYSGSSRAINQVPQQNNNSLTANFQF